eukprot:366036-Chlamydomonas_euryale.AAC.8
MHVGCQGTVDSSTAARPPGHGIAPLPPWHRTTADMALQNGYHGIAPQHHHRHQPLNTASFYQPPKIAATAPMRPPDAAQQ